MIVETAVTARRTRRGDTTAVTAVIVNTPADRRAVTAVTAPIVVTP